MRGLGLGSLEEILTALYPFHRESIRQSQMTDARVLAIGILSAAPGPSLPFPKARNKPTPVRTLELNRKAIPMITPGAILIEKGTLLPEPLQLETESHASGWAGVTNNLDGHQIEKALSTAGWTFFYMAGAIKTTAFGFDRARMIHAALKRLIANVRRQKCNCLQIDEVEMHWFLGMPYVSVSAHSRHIQKGLAFSSR